MLPGAAPDREVVALPDVITALERALETAVNPVDLIQTMSRHGDRGGGKVAEGS